MGTGIFKLCCNPYVIYFFFCDRFQFFFIELYLRNRFYERAFTTNSVTPPPTEAQCYIGKWVMEVTGRENPAVRLRNRLE